MRVLFLLVALFSSVSTYAQICYVDMVDSYHRVVRTFSAYADYNGRCREGMKECNRTIRTSGMYGVTCAERYSPAPTPNPYPNPSPSPYPNPQPYPSPYPTPNPQPYPGNANAQIQAYLNMNDATLVNYAQMGIGNCIVNRGTYGAACNYYLKVNGFGYPQGTGCTNHDYTASLGCYIYSDLENTACVVRAALSSRACM